MDVKINSLFGKQIRVPSKNEKPTSPEVAVFDKYTLRRSHGRVCPNENIPSQNYPPNKPPKCNLLARVYEKHRDLSPDRWALREIGLGRLNPRSLKDPKNCHLAAMHSRLPKMPKSQAKNFSPDQSRSKD
jgi:hypothetical protein